MPYSYITFLQLKQLLAGRLSDPFNQFWSAPELEVNLQLSLRLWNSLTSYYRTRWTFNPASGANFIDLPSVSGSALSYTITDRDAISWLEYFLMEPQTVVWGDPWSGTAMFTMNDLIDALEKRINQFFLETGAVVSQPDINPITGVTTGRVPLDDNTIDVRRVEWQPYASPTTHFPLEKSDTNELQNLIPNWSYSPARPQVYTLYPTPLLTMQLGPIPNTNGSLDMLVIKAHPALTPGLVETTLSIFQDLIPYLVFGAMSTLLNQAGPAYDSDRAAYCEERYKEGVALVKQRIFTTIFYGELNGIPIPLRSTYDLDFLTPNWTVGTGRPTQMALEGLNMLVLSPAPDTSGYSVLLDLVQPAPVPTTDDALVQLGREELNTILDEAEHLSMFKRGGNEFMSTITLHQAFLQSATEYNDRLRAEAKNFKFLQEQATEEENDRPRRVSREEI